MLHHPWQQAEKRRWCLLPRPSVNALAVAQSRNKGTFDQGDDADCDDDHEEGLWLCMQPLFFCRRTHFMLFTFDQGDDVDYDDAIALFRYSGIY